MQNETYCGTTMSPHYMILCDAAGKSSGRPCNGAFLPYHNQMVCTAAEENLGGRKPIRGYSESDIPGNKISIFYIISLQIAPTKWVKELLTLKIYTLFC